jgi:hypothetical protein
MSDRKLPTEPRPPHATDPAMPALPIDPWVAASLLQNAIRRGEADLAEQAALRLSRLRGAEIWRRLLVIACEEVGVAAVRALVQTATACADPNWRLRFGGDVAALRSVVRLLADAPKDRSADHLVRAASSHPAFEEARSRIAGASRAERRDLIEDFDVPLATRAIAVCASAGVKWAGDRRGPSDLFALVTQFGRLGVPADLLWATNSAAARTRKASILMLPLLWLAAYREPNLQIVASAVPDPPILDGVALYAFDKRSAIGKTALQRFARDCGPVRDVLSFFVEPHRARDVIECAAFHVEAAAVAKKLIWEGSAALETLGVEADMLRAGAPLPGIAPTLNAVRENLGHLNAIRVRLFAAQRAAAAGQSGRTTL